MILAAAGALAVRSDRVRASRVALVFGDVRDDFANHRILTTARAYDDRPFDLTFAATVTDIYTACEAINPERRLALAPDKTSRRPRTCMLSGWRCDCEAVHLVSPLRHRRPRCVDSTNVASLTKIVKFEEKK